MPSGQKQAVRNDGVKQNLYICRLCRFPLIPCSKEGQIHSLRWRGGKQNKKSRGDPTRTGDHLVPNQVRYQLRYTPMAFHYFAKSGAKVRQLIQNSKFKIQNYRLEFIILHSSCFFVHFFVSLWAQIKYNNIKYLKQ